MTIRELNENVLQYFIEIIDERHHARFDIGMRMFLFVLSRIYYRAVRFRQWLYNKRIFRPRALGCLVVSIGNLTCGGTGKPPWSKSSQEH